MENIGEKITSQIMPWLFTSGIKILAIVVVVFIINRFGSTFIERIVRKVIRTDHFLSKEAEKKKRGYPYWGFFHDTKSVCVVDCFYDDYFRIRS